MIVSPKYNGSFPGILKAFIDSCKPEFLTGKKAALVSISTGRAGNLRGMVHLTDILHNPDVQVLPLKIPVFRAHTLLDENRRVSDVSALTTLRRQIGRFMEF